MDFDLPVNQPDRSVESDSSFNTSWLLPHSSSLSNQMNAEYFSPQPVLPPGFDENPLSTDRRANSIPLAISTAVPLSHLSSQSHQSPLTGSAQTAHQLGMSFTPPSVTSHWPSMLARRNSFQPLLAGGPLSASSPLSGQILNSSVTTPVSGHVLSSSTTHFPVPTLAPAATISPSRGSINGPAPTGRPARQAPTPRKTLTDSDRKRMCEFHEQHPTVKQTDIGAIFGVERSTVSKVLRLKEKYLRKNDDPLKSPIRSPIRKARSKPSDVERALATWARNQEDKRGKPIEDEEFRQRYAYFANLIGCVETAPKCEQTGWADGFRQRNQLLARSDISSSAPPASAVSVSVSDVTMSPTSLPASFSPLSDIRDAVMNSLSPSHISSIDARIQISTSLPVLQNQNEAEASIEKASSASSAPSSHLTSDNALSKDSISNDEGNGEKDMDDTSGLPLALRPESVRAGSQSPHFPPPPLSATGSTRSGSKKASPSAASLPPLTTTGLNPPSTLRSAGGNAGSATSQKHGFANTTPLTSSTTGSFRHFQSPMTPNSAETSGAVADVSVYPLTPNGPGGLVLDSSGAMATHAFSYSSAAQNALFKQRRGPMGPPAPMGVSTNVSAIGVTAAVPASHMMFGVRRTSSFPTGPHVPSPLQSMPITSFSADCVPSRGEACAAIDVLMRYLQSSSILVEADELHHISKVADRLQHQASADPQFGNDDMSMDLGIEMGSGDNPDFTSMGMAGGANGYHHNPTESIADGSMSLDMKICSPGPLGASHESGHSMFDMETIQMDGLSDDSIMLNSGLNGIGSIDQSLYMNSGGGTGEPSGQMASALQ